jgi:hypothetical protein
MKVAYIFSSSNSHTILSKMIVPQLEKGTHGADVVGMFFFVDNTFMLVKGNAVGERLSMVAKQSGMLLMACDQCAYERQIADNLVAGAKLGCFPDLYKALGQVGIDQAITL